MAERTPTLDKGKYVPVLVVLLIIAAFFIGSLTTKISMLQSGTGTTPGGTAAVPNQPPPNQPNQPDPNKRYGVKEGHLPYLGNKNAKVSIIVFSDFECPFCRRHYFESITRIKKDYLDTGKAKMYFRHYPLEFHKMAKPAALASECANEQGKFWEMHDKIFTEIGLLGDNPTFTADDLKTWALELKVDASKFNQCFDSNKYDSNISDDIQDAASVDVSGTPTTFINGKIVVGAQPYDSFKTIIEEELK